MSEVKTKYDFKIVNKNNSILTYLKISVKPKAEVYYFRYKTKGKINGKQ